jgi:cytochrome P450
MPTDDFDPLAPETFTSAHALYQDMRQCCPVAHSQEWQGFWALLRYDDVVQVLRSPQTFLTSVQNVVPKVAFTGRRPPLHLDPPEHTPYRRALNPFFSQRKMDAIEPAVRAIAHELLAPFVEAGGGDLCAEFTRRYPGHVFAEFFGLSAELSLAIKEVTVLYNRALQEANDDLVKATSLRLYEIARQIIEDRKACPRDPADDVTSALLGTLHEGQPLPEPMVLGTIRQMIVVGMIAPSVFIGSMFVHLAQHPALQDQLRADASLLPAALEEYLRLFTPYRGFARTANRQVEIGGRSIQAGEPIALVYASANRDEAVFPDGDRFVLHRENIQQHVAFGLGPHRCAGEPLARLMLQIALEVLLARTERIELGGEVAMTRWPEWGTLTAPLRVIAARSPSG